MVYCQLSNEILANGMIENTTAFNTVRKRSVLKPSSNIFEFEKVAPLGNLTMLTLSF